MEKKQELFQPAIGQGKVTLNIKITNKAFTYTLNAYPEPFGKFPKANVEFKKQYALTLVGIAQLENDLKAQFFAKFKNPELYFNKLEGSIEINTPKGSSYSSLEREKNKMTEEYFKELFVQHYEVLEKVAEENKEKTQGCTLF